jgi:hypothetical protein
MSLLIGATSSVFSDDLYINNSAYAQAGWRVGTTTTYVGKLFNNAGVLSLQADGTRSVGFGNFTNGEIVRIDGINSRVGIGTTSPDSKLEVSSVGSTQLKVTNTANSVETVVLSQSGSGWIGTETNHTLKLGTGYSAKMIIGTNGNVGIGTTSPSEKLDIEGSGSTNLEINNTLNSISLTLGAQATAARLTAGTGNRLGFGANNTADQVTISTSGNVGIGTTIPAYKLDVSGDIRGTAYRIGSANILSGSI